jgi:type II restriction/modification system DNA methylase subunit YeeA
VDTSKLKRFASFARTSLIEQVGTRLKTVLADQSLVRRENAAAVAELEKKIKELGKERVIEMVAYTWFNRFCALRFMDVNQYTTIGTVSAAEGFTQPEILTEAKQGVIDEELKVDRAKIVGLLDGTRPSLDAQSEVYQQLLIAVCNSYHKLMPFMFEKIADYTELLLPEDLLSDNSVLAETRKALTVENCADVEVIGWLYQFYVSEKKDDVFAALKKGKKITPENIPAATQLFTPHWIVRYLVENSLGRLWMLNHPDSKLIDRMDYCIKPEEPDVEFLKIGSPEEIKVCDPACGSGHMLTYAFDLLYEIYREEQYLEPEIPALILKNNLYGIEIDQRAGALTAFALTMKAREKDKRFFTRKASTDASASNTPIQNPNICVLENIERIEPEDVSAYREKVGSIFTDGLAAVVNQWEEADNFGSLIRPLVTDVSEVLELLRAAAVGEDLFLAKVHHQVLKALRQADYLSPKYHVVVANPPYMGRKSMNLALKKFAQIDYADNKLDVFAMFIERCCELSLESGYIAMITMQSWMFLSSYKELRDHLLTETTIQTLAQFGARAFDTIGGGVVSTAAFVTKKFSDRGYKAVYLQLTEGESEAEKQQMLLERLDLRFEASSSDFDRVDGSPISYWLPDVGRSAFERGEPIKKIAEPRQGMATTDNNQFLRMWYEVSHNRIGFACESAAEANGTGKKWFPYNKGGSFRKWYGNLEYVVNYESDGAELKSVVKEKYREKDYAQGFSDEKWNKLIEVWVLKNQHSYFLPALTWSFVSSSAFGVRRSDAGFIFDVGGSSAFPPRFRMNEFTAYLCSKVAYFFMSALNPTLNFQVENVAALPVIDDAVARIHDEVSEIAESAVAISRRDWNSYELAWDFTTFQFELPMGTKALEISFGEWREKSRETVSQLQALEETNNRLFIEAYGLSDALTPNVAHDQITLKCNPYHVYGSDKCESDLESLLLADTMREIISYAVGCIFGRYSLDKPGLILANQGETVTDYYKQIPEPTVAPDEDNVIPILENEWFSDDISQRFKDFLKVTFGSDFYEENLEFLENALYPDNSSAKKCKTIRDYFLKEFYDHHLKMYKKRPIYWLFSSPKGTFNALIYMHRYRPETVGKVLECLRDFRDKLAHHAEQRQGVADSASESKAEKTKAVKDVAAIKKQLKELEDYEKTLFEVAAKKISIDLDDGVKHNYPLFGSVLKKIPGLDATDD